jgi:OOP family OmpA-OmpF porin
LAPCRGGKFRSSAPDTAPFYVPIKGAVSRNWWLPARSSRHTTQPPDGCRTALFRIAYHDALTAAGWTIVMSMGAGRFPHRALHSERPQPVGHPLQERTFNDIRVADAGAVNKDMGSDLKTNCHVAIYGVLFDFNKSTLQPASDPVLQQILDLLKKNPTQKIEVQGHTDNVGGRCLQPDAV